MGEVGLEILGELGTDGREKITAGILLTEPLSLRPVLLNLGDPVPLLLLLLSWRLANLGAGRGGDPSGLVRIHSVLVFSELFQYQPS